MKKISAFLLTLVMMIGMLPVFNLTVNLNAQSFQSGDYSYEVLNEKEKTCKIISYRGNGKNVRIPSMLDRYKVTEIGFDSFVNCEYISSFFIPESIQNIEENVFTECYGLTSITVDSKNPAYSSKDGVLFNKNKTVIIKYPNKKSNKAYTIPNSVHTVGVEAFNSCFNLTSVTIPDSVKTIQYSAFTFYYGEINERIVSPLKTVKMGKGVQRIEEEAFSCCSSMTSITLPESLLSIGEAAFFGCSSLTEVTIPSNVNDIDAGSFGNCPSLKNIKVSSKNPDYTSVDGVLYSKDKTNIYFYPNGRTNSTYTIPSGVQNIGEGAFFYCRNLKTVNIPLTVKTIKFGAFQYCKDLTSLTIPESVQTIGDMAFYGCPSLKAVTIPESVRVLQPNVLGESPNVTIYGTKYSAAEIHANRYNIPFVEIKIEIGDVDADGKITLSDAMFIINDVAKKAPLHELLKGRADINADNKITLEDAMYIINFVAKKSDTIYSDK